MRNTGYFKGKNITVVGAARSGIACANLLFELGARVSISDSSDNASTRQAIAGLKSPEIKFELGAHSAGFIRSRDMIVVSPGVPFHAGPLSLAREENIPVLSEIEIGWMLCPAAVIAVTGSNGKTTTATLIGRVIEESGSRAFVCGNIGRPFCAQVALMRDCDFTVLEVSSFQLETIRDFKPKVAVMLNFSRNHLDRHKDIEEYLEAKKRIFMNQDKNDFLVLNADDPVVSRLTDKAKSRVLFFSKEDNSNPNYAAVMSAATALGIGTDVCLEVFDGFKGLEHRLEYVASIKGVNFINDSKATTAESCLMALRSTPGAVILIAGGRDKGVDYSIICSEAKDKVKRAILIGEAKGKISGVLKGWVNFEEAASLVDAVKAAFKGASAGDTVLLSPMCSSFDMFSNYEERGTVFKAAVRDLEKDSS